MKEINTDWALNPVKLKRAFDRLDAKVLNKEIKSYTEEDVKTLYLSYAGALRE